MTKRNVRIPGRRERPVAAIFRTGLFNPAERFIQEQAASLTRWRPLLVGLERKGEILSDLKEGMILPANVAERLATVRAELVEALPFLLPEEKDSPSTGSGRTELGGAKSRA